MRTATWSMFFLLGASLVPALAAERGEKPAASDSVRAQLVVLRALEDSCQLARRVATYGELQWDPEYIQLTAIRDSLQKFSPENPSLRVVADRMSSLELEKARAFNGSGFGRRCADAKLRMRELQQARTKEATGKQPAKPTKRRRQ